MREFLYNTYLSKNYCREKKKYDDSLMLDENKNVCETTSSNIFSLEKNLIYT